MAKFSVTKEVAYTIAMFHTTEDSKLNCTGPISKCYKEEGLSEKMGNGKCYYFKCLGCGRNITVDLTSEYSIIQEGEVPQKNNVMDVEGKK